MENLLFATAEAPVNHQAMLGLMLAPVLILGAHLLRPNRVDADAPVAATAISSQRVWELNRMGLLPTPAHWNLQKDLAFMSLTLDASRERHQSRLL